MNNEYGPKTGLQASVLHMCLNIRHNRARDVINNSFQLFQFIFKMQLPALLIIEALFLFINYALINFALGIFF